MLFRSIIKEITEESYNQLRSDSLYKIVRIEWQYNGVNEFQIEKANKEIPGIKEYLQSEENIGDAYEG